MSESEIVLVIGTKNYSSWSLRPWILLRKLGIPFREVVLDFDDPAFHEEVARHSPSRRVPVLIDGDVRVWESIAICEYASEKAAGRGWPEDAAARAHARAISAEMHAGFAALRRQCPMNARARGRRVPSTPELEADLRRIDALWTECRRRHAAAGPWLFGRYSVADAMFAPVALRCLTYGLPLGEEARGYLDAALADGDLREWIRAAEADTHVVPHEEVGL